MQTGSQVADGIWGAEEDVVVRPARFGGVSELPVVRNIVDVTMVGLLGGGPILAIRAVRVFLEDSYAARASSAARELPYSGRHSNDD